MRVFFFFVVVLVVVGAAACTKAATPTTRVEGGKETGWDDKEIGTLPREVVVFEDRVRLLAVEKPEHARVGEQIPFTLYWLIERDLAGRAPRVFVHARVAGGEKNVAQADHDFPGVSDVVPGDVVVDRFDVFVPGGVDGSVDLFVGLYEGDHRWGTAPKQAGDGFVFFGGVEGVARAEAFVDAVTGAIVVDGVLDEADWQTAPPLALKDFLARDVPLLSTTAKLLWSKDDLYLAFVADDPDVFSPYTKRDDPLYESEAYEIFVDADGDAADKDGEYVELQSNAYDVHFDSAFAGGRRQHMQVDYDVPFETKTVVTGRTLVQEWRIPVAALRGVPPGEPKAGAVWRVNLFRLERRRRGEKVVGSEASAWSPPLSNDFHNVARFGVLRFR